ncbi:carboxypeptidase-like regulatory domain-containing protein [Bacteroidota bacterium]
MKTQINIRWKLSLTMIMIATCLVAWSNDLNQPDKVDEEVKVFTGKVIDSETKKPVIFANVYISGTSIGTVSNSDGEFVLKVPVSNLENTVNIDYIGYASTEISLNNLQGNNIDVGLNPDPVSIQEVIVRVDDPLKLLKMALNKIHINYASEPAMLTGFYRETIKKNRNYVAVSEAIMDIYKSSYKSDFSTDRVRILKGRKSADVERMDTVLFKLQGGPTTSVLLDIVKNPSNLLSAEYIDFYDYSFAGIINVDEKQNYVIGFDQKKDHDLPLYSGKIYLDMDNLAITRIDFNLSEYGLKNANQSLVRKKPVNMKVDVVGANYLVKYRELDGKWYLNHVRSEMKFKCKWDKKLFKSNYSTMFEMAVTDMDTENVEKIKFSESAKFSDVFIDHVQYYEDEDFWGDYNYIKPDESIESAIYKLNKKIAKK